MATTIEYNIKVNDGQAISSIAGLEKELSGVNDELKQVDVNSQAFKDLSERAQILERDLKKVNSEVEGFTAEKKFQAADGAIKALGGSVASVVGALGLLGIESEKLGQFEQRAASAIAFGIGLKDLSEGYKQIADSTVLATAKAKIFGNVSKQALIATGVGAFVVALGLVVAYWDEITAAISGSNNELETQNDLLRQQITDGDVQLELLKLNLQATQLRGDSDEEIVKSLRKQLLLQQEQYTQLIENLTLQLETEQTQARQVTFWEKIKLGAAQAIGGVGLYAKTLADAVNPNTERAEELQQKLNEARKASAGITVQLAQLDANEEAKRKQRVADRQKDLDEDQKRKEEEVQKEQQRLDTIAAILEDYRQRQKDIDAQTEVEKVTLEEERKLAELERLKATEEEKQAIRDFYAERRKEAQDEDDENAKDAANKRAEDAIAAAIAEKEAITAIEQAKFGILAQFGGLLNELAGENKTLAIGAVVAQQAAAIGQIVSATGLANAKAVAASPLTFGQPWVTINTISAGLSIATAVASAVKSIQQIKNAAGGTGGGGGGAVSGGTTQLPGGGGAATATSPFETFTPTGTSPEEQAASAPPIRAYVIGGDVTSSQEANARLNARREID